MDWKDIDTTHCGVLAAADLIGDRWSLLIVRDLLMGLSKFNDLQTHTGASTAILAKRLRVLSDAGLLEERHCKQPGQRGHTEYFLSRKGLGLAQIIGAMAQFGYDELTLPQRPLVQYRDAETGQRVRLAAFREDGKQVAPEDVVIEVNPDAFSPKYRAPSSRERKKQPT